MRQKMHKYEVGKNRPTENRAGYALIAEQVNEWVAKVDEAAKTNGIDEQILSVAKVLAELAEKIRGGEIDKDVFISLLRRRSVIASLEYALKHNLIKGVPKWG